MTRRVINYPNADGFIELGPIKDAHGLGDTLTITPCALRLPKAILLLPPTMAQYAPLFDGLCPVKLTENYPEFPLCGGKPVTESNLAICGIASKGDLPVVRITIKEACVARDRLAAYRNPLALVPTCSRTWTFLRGKPPEFFAPIIAELGRRHTILQFGFSDYPTLPGTVRMKFSSFRESAALYAQIGCYVGLNTGDYHLMIAAGGRCVVAEPPRQSLGYNPLMWRYGARSVYVDPATPEAMISAALKMFSQ